MDDSIEKPKIGRISRDVSDVWFRVVLVGCGDSAVVDDSWKLFRGLHRASAFRSMADWGVGTGRSHGEKKAVAAASAGRVELRIVCW